MAPCYFRFTRHQACICLCPINRCFLIMSVRLSKARQIKERKVAETSHLVQVPVISVTESRVGDGSVGHGSVGADRECHFETKRSKVKVTRLHIAHRVGQKRTVLMSHNFAMTNDRKACNTLKVSEFCLE